MNKILQLQGLDCPNCATELENKIKKIDGIKDASISFINQKITLEYTNQQALEKAIECINHFEEVKVVIQKEETTLLRLQNLHCAACGEDLQEELEKIKGVDYVSVDFITQSIHVQASEEGLRQVIKKANRFDKVKVINEEEILPKKESHIVEIVDIIISSIFFIFAILTEKIWRKQLSFDLQLIFYAISYVVVAWQVLLSTAKNITKGKIFDENFLMTIASIGAICLQQYSEGVAVMLLYQIGELLQALAVGSSRKSISNLMNLKSEKASLVKGEEIISVVPETLKEQDIILVKAGEKVAVDSILLTEEVELDTKSLTGESALRTIKKGQEVLSGSIVVGKAVKMQVIRPYSNSAVAKILDLVENSSIKKSKPEKFITKFARYYTPIVCAIALLLGGIVPLILGLSNGGGYSIYYRQWINTALIFLVISCPCALIISVPLTYFSGIGKAAQYGILVKGSTYLDTLSNISIAAFDKTGTITQGDFFVVNTYGEKQALLYAAAIESNSSHPVAKAFEKIETSFQAENVQEYTGKGMEGRIENKKILVGKSKFLEENGVIVPKIDSISTLVYVAEEGEYLGAIEIDDRLKKGVNESLLQLKELGVKRNIILTGDTLIRAKAMVEKIEGVDEVIGELLPDEKLKKAEELKTQGNLLYVGDGINDAPVMIVADCSASMGKLGSGAAIEASDIVLVSDDIASIPFSIKIAQKTRKIVLENIIFSIAMKVCFMVLGLFQLIPLSVAVFGDVGVMLLAVFNSQRMRLKIK